MSPAPRSRRRAAKEPEPEAQEPEVTEEEAEETEEEEGGKRTRDTSPLPTGEELYEAKYVEGQTWQEIRDNLDPRIRSPKGLALITAYVIENGLEEEHPEFASLADLEGEELAAAIVEWHDAGQGWSVLAARTDLKISEVQDIYADAGGENPGRVGGQRYGGGRSVRAKEVEGEAEEGEEEAEAQPAAKKPAAKKPASKKPAATKAASPAAKKPAPRRKAPTPS